MPFSVFDVRSAGLAAVLSGFALCLVPTIARNPTELQLWSKPLELPLGSRLICKTLAGPRSYYAPECPCQATAIRVGLRGRGWPRLAAAESRIQDWPGQNPANIPSPLTGKLRIKRIGIMIRGPRPLTWPFLARQVPGAAGLGYDSVRLRRRQAWGFKIWRRCRITGTGYRATVTPAAISSVTLAGWQTRQAWASYSRYWHKISPI